MRSFKLKFFTPKKAHFFQFFWSEGVIWHFFGLQKNRSGDMVELNPEPKFHQKRSNGSRIMTGDGRTDRRTDMGQIIYLSFVKKDRSTRKNAPIGLKLAGIVEGDALNTNIKK